MDLKKKNNNKIKKVEVALIFMATVWLVTQYSTNLEKFGI